QVAQHETSHAVWAVMERAGLIPDSGGDKQLGVRSALDTARDEAVAMQLAGQGKISHPNIVQRLRAEGQDEASIERYRTASEQYAKAMDGVQGVAQRDSIYGFMQAQDWGAY